MEEHLGKERLTQVLLLALAPQNLATASTDQEDVLHCISVLVSRIGVIELLGLMVSQAHHHKPP